MIILVFPDRVEVKLDTDDCKCTVGLLGSTLVVKEPIRIRFTKEKILDLAKYVMINVTI